MGERNEDAMPWWVLGIPACVAVVLVLALLSPSCSIQIRIHSTPVEATP